MAAGPVRELFGRGGQLGNKKTNQGDHYGTEFDDDDITDNSATTTTEDITFIQGKWFELSLSSLHTGLSIWPEFCVGLTDMCSIFCHFFVLVDGKLAEQVGKAA